jgi:hypothetical protein
MADSGGSADERNLGVLGLETSKKNTSFCPFRRLRRPPAASTLPSAESPR